MTTLYQETARCGVCGTEAEYPQIGSTNSFGSPDLDTRPPEMQRSTMFAWVQRCPGCGYCGPDVREAPTAARVIIEREDYRAQLDDPAYPELAISFLCQAMIQEEMRDHEAATWAVISAAWACDDAGFAEQARMCWRTAAEMLVLGEEHSQEVAEQAGASPAILVDLLRRSGQPEQARKTIATVRGTISEDIILRVLDYQEMLLDRGDVAVHTIEEALAVGPTHDSVG